MNTACAVRKITLLLTQLYSSSLVQFALWQLYVTSSLHHTVLPLLFALGWGSFPYSRDTEYSKVLIRSAHNSIQFQFYVCVVQIYIHYLEAL